METDDGFPVVFSHRSAGFFYLFYLFSHPGLTLTVGHGLVVRQRCAVPVDPLEVVLQPMALVSIPSGGPVGFVIDEPVPQGFSGALMVVGGEKG